MRLDFAPSLFVVVYLNSLNHFNEICFIYDLIKGNTVLRRGACLLIITLSAPSYLIQVIQAVFTPVKPISSIYNDMLLHIKSFASFE